jgi:hypothetical protein
VIDIITLIVAVVLLVVMVRWMRTRSPRRNPGSVTDNLSVDDGGVSRRMADGREESASWNALTEVELVLTPVNTADGTKEFLVLAEDGEHGCLVPLGVGHDPAVIRRLSRLPGFDLRAFDHARGGRSPSRTVIWKASPERA